MKQIVLLFMLGMLSVFSEAQVISIRESVSNGSYNVNFNESNIVDINSELEVHLNRDSLAVKISRSTNTNTKLTSKLEELNYILEYQHEILKILSDTVQNLSKKEKIELLGNYSLLMRDFYVRLIQNKELRAKASSLYEEYYNTNSLPDKNEYPTAQSYVIKNLFKETTVILDDIKSLVSVDRIDIQLVAFLDTKAKPNQKVHIENFDTYSSGEYYEVPRWVNSFSEEDIQAFNKTRNLSSDLNKVLTSGFEGLNEVLSDNLPSYRCANYIVKRSQYLLDHKDSIFKENKKVAVDFVSAIESIAKKQVDLASEITNNNDLSADSNVLAIFNTTRQRFINQAKKIPGELDSLVNLLPSQFMTANSGLIELGDSIKYLKSFIKEDLSKIDNIIKYTSGLITPSKKTYEKTEEVGKEVFNYNIEQLPPVGYINLKTTGKRGNGDELRISLRIRTQKDKEMQRPGVTIEPHTLALYKVRFYSESNVSLILANPYNNTDKVALTNKLQFAPSGSLLFKYGSRKSKAWNYISPGFGFNMSTPDFDLDGVPDIAIGGVVSLINNIVAVGWSYNTKTDSPFWFFGLSLPFSVPGVPINNIQNNSNVRD